MTLPPVSPDRPGLAHATLSAVFYLMGEWIPEERTLNDLDPFDVLCVSGGSDDLHVFRTEGQQDGALLGLWEFYGVRYSISGCRVVTDRVHSSGAPHSTLRSL